MLHMLLQTFFPRLASAPGLLVLCLLTGIPYQVVARESISWSDAELSLLAVQWIGNLPDLAEDPSNQYANNPDAALLGHRLFFDKRLSANGKISCASCHDPQRFFTDGRATAEAIGDSARSTPNILGIAHSPWYFWDGRSDSLWSQALVPLEAEVEHGGNRSQFAHIIAGDPLYKTAYIKIFGNLPDLSDKHRFPRNASPIGLDENKKNWRAMAEADRRAVNRIFANIGKAIAAYERLLVPGKSRFDLYVESLQKDTPTDVLSTDELAGLKLFMGKAMCVTCHQGPLFTNHGFHNIGTPDRAARKPDHIPGIVYLLMDKPEPDRGRYTGVRQALQSQFNCLSEYSDAPETECAELRFAATDYRTTLGAFKVPTLRNISQTAPYTHAGVFPSLADILQHYNNPPAAPVGHQELQPLQLSNKELKQIEAFLRSLDSPVNVPAHLLKPPRD